MPGHGPSPRVLPGAGFDEVIDALAPWTTGRRVLVGYSLGARLALSLALRHPGDLRAVVLVGGTPGIEDPAERAQRARRTAHEAGGIAWALSTLGTGRMPPLWEALATAPFAVHAVTGDRDEKFTRIAEEMVRRSGGRVVHHRVAGAGHNVALEDPAAVARVVAGAGWSLSIGDLGG